MGNDAAVAFAGSQGHFELNVFVPVMARNLLESIRLLTLGVRGVRRHVASTGIEANVERAKEFAESSPSIGTALNPYLGYEVAAEIVKEATTTGRSIRDVVQAAQAHDRRRARPCARRDRHDPRAASS